MAEILKVFFRQFKQFLDQDRGEGVLRLLLFMVPGSLARSFSRPAEGFTRLKLNMDKSLTHLGLMVLNGPILEFFSSQLRDYLYLYIAKLY